MELDTAVLFVLALGGWLFLNWQISQTRELIKQMHPEEAPQVDEQMMKWWRENWRRVVTIILFMIALMAASVIGAALY